MKITVKIIDIAFGLGIGAYFVLLFTAFGVSTWRRILKEKE